MKHLSPIAVVFVALFALAMAGSNPAFGGSVDGYATVNGTTTGGEGGPIVTVSNATDFSYYVNQSGRYVVQFQGTLTISNVAVASNKTILGLGTNATLVGNLVISGVNNIIVRNLFITNPTIPGEGDGITIWNFSDHIWVDHCTFYDCRDGELDMAFGADFITVSWCRFYYTFNSGHNFVNLIGADDSFTGDAGRLHVTFHHNWWSTLCHERMPRVRYGRIHSYNNYFSAPGNGYCVRAALESEVLIEGNYFQNVRTPWEKFITTGTTGKIRAVSNAFVNVTAGTIVPSMDTVFTPPYPYTLGQTNLVASIVTNNAGAGKLSTNLTISLPASAYEGDGVLTNAGRISILSVPSSDLLVNLASSNTNKVLVPPTVTITAGQTFATFDLTIVDDLLINGNQLVTVTASATDFAGDGDNMTVKDNDVHQFVISTIASPQSAGTPFTVSLTAQDVNGAPITVYQNALNLTGSGDGGAVMIQPTNVTPWINGVWIGGVRVDTPDTNVRLTASDGAGLSVTGNVFNVQLGPLDHFAFNAVPSPQHQDVPFPVSIIAKDAGHNALTNFNGTVNLTAFAGSSNVVFSADFEDGLDGFAIDNSIGYTNGSGNGLWHLSTGRATNLNHSAYHSLYYGQNEGLSGGGNYNTGNSINEGVITSPLIDLTGQTAPLTLSFNYLLDIYQYYYDNAYVEVSRNGGPFTYLLTLYNPTYGVWQPLSTDLSDYAGSQIQLRFHFISYYQFYNLEGWYVDDVVIRNGNADTPLNLIPTNSTAFVSGVWTGTVAVLDAATNVFLRANDGVGHSGDSPRFAVQANADLETSMFTSPATVQAGSDLIYVVFVDNNGPERASLVTLTDSLPPNVTFNSVQLSQGTYAFNNYNSTLTCSFGSLNSGDFAIAVITVTPQIKMLLTNTVTASTGATDTNQANNTVTAITTVQGEGVLQVNGSDFLSTGPAGGVFYPDGQYYTLYNIGRDVLNWSAHSSAAWITMSETNGTLAPFSSTNFFVSLNAQAAAMPIGIYTSDVVFTNLTNGKGTASFTAKLTALNPLPVTGPAISGGNGNGWIDPYECNALYFVLRNNSSVTVTGITATLSTTTSGLTVAQGSLSYPDLLPGESASNAVPFYVSTAPGFPCGGAVNFLFNVTSGKGSNSVEVNLTHDYVVTPSTNAVIVPGTNDIGNHCYASYYGCLMTIELPFNYSLYGQTYSNVTVSSHGNLQFVGNNPYTGYYYSCLPIYGFTSAIFAYWGYLDTASLGRGIFTSTNGTTPNRIFNIEWRANDSYGSGLPVNFEIRLYEGQQRFDVLYGELNGNNYGIVGVQNGFDFYTPFRCFYDALTLTNSLQLAFAIPCSNGAGGCNAVNTPFFLSNISVVSNQFGFNVTGEPNQVAVVEISTDLVNWSPLVTNTLGVVPFYFSSSDWTNSANRFYRARLQ